MEGSEAESCGEAFVPRHSCYPAVFSPCWFCRLSACWFAFVSPLTSVLWFQAKIVFLSVNLLKILKPLCGLSVHVDFLFWELCFNVLAIFFSPPHLSHDSHFSFLPLFIQPPLISRNSPEEETLHPFFLLWYLKGLLWLSIQKLQIGMLCVFLGGFIWEKCWKFSQLLFSICASVCVFCVVPHFHLTRNISLLVLQFTRVSHLYEEKQKLFLSQRENMSEDRWRDFWLSNVSWVTNCLILFFPTVMWQVWYWVRNLLTEFTCLHTSCYDLHHFSSLTFAFQHHFPVNCLSSPLIYVRFDGLKPGILLWKCTPETSCHYYDGTKTGTTVNSTSVCGTLLWSWTYPSLRNEA